MDRLAHRAVQLATTNPKLAYTLVEAAYDPSSLGYRPEDLESMDDDERDEALAEVFDRLIDVAEAAEEAFRGHLTTGERAALSKAAAGLKPLLRARATHRVR